MKYQYKVYGISVIDSNGMVLVDALQYHQNDPELKPYINDLKEAYPNDFVEIDVIGSTNQTVDNFDGI
jgi:hypothetical protein